MKYARVMRLRKDNHFIDAEGNNLFELVLRVANNKPGKIIETTVFDLDGTNGRPSTMTLGKEAIIGHIGVEYHNRWCFYYHDRNGRNFLADAMNGEVSRNFGGLFKTEREAIEQALKNCGIEY